MYQEAKNKKIQSNLKDVEKNLKKPEYIFKIERWCDKFNFDFETILQKAKTDYYFRAIFSKDPNKQNIFEKVAVEHIKKIKIVKNFRKLNNHGPKSLFLSGGQICKNIDKKQNKPTKTIDFKWKIVDNKGNNYHCYAYHKYIKETGGAQDNQFIDVKNSIKNANFSESSNLFFFICDGDYFSDIKFNELKSIKKSLNIHILKIMDLEKLLERLIFNEK